MKNTIFVSLLLASVSLSLSIKVFNFKKTSSKTDGSFTEAKLENVPTENLPSQFTLCTSHLQGRIDQNTKTIFVIYRDQEHTQPWLSVGFWEEGLLWANLENEYWYLLYQIPVSRIFGWAHICTEIDLVEGVIRCSVNGLEVRQVEEVKRERLPPRLYLRLGVVHHNWYQDNLVQFHGQVTNIRVYRDLAGLQLESLTGSPCLHSYAETFMLWDEMEWNLTEDVATITLRDEDFCRDSNTFNVMLPVPMTYGEAKDSCLKLGKGSISEPAQLDSSVMLDPCPYTWTPYTDIAVENRFINEYTGQVARLSLWRNFPSFTVFIIQ